MKNDEIKKLHYELETFDFYSTEPLDFCLLTDIEKKLLKKLLLKNEKRRLYTFIIGRYYKFQKKRMFEVLRAPNEFPEEEFKFVIDFKNVISEHEFTEEKLSDECYTYLGIAEIDTDFYVENYDYFNSGHRQFLIICDEDKIKQIDNKLANAIEQIINNEDGYSELTFFKLNLDNFISTLDNDCCVLLQTTDTWEFKNIIFLANDEEDVKEITKYFDELHEDYISFTNKTIS